MATIPADGRMTSFSTLGGPLTGAELHWIVSPGNAAQGVLYNITLTTEAAFFGAFPFLNTEIIKAGATYNVLTTDTRILVNKTLGSPTSIVFPLAGSMQYPYGVLVKDLKGDAPTNGITISFTGGELCDGLSTIPINTVYGWYTINPVPGGGAWYLTYG